MKYVRFMSRQELESYLNGETLHNETIWRENQRNSNAIGFCFFNNLVAPAERLKYVTGVVNISKVAVFERIAGKPMRKSTGIYRDPERDALENWLDILLGEIETMDVPEYSIEEYSQKTMKLVKVGTPVAEPDGSYSIIWESKEKK